MESKFTGSLIGYAWVHFIYYASIAVSAGLLMPFGFVYKEKWMINNTSITGKQLIFKGRGTTLFIKQLVFSVFGPIIIGGALTIMLATDINPDSSIPTWFPISTSSILFVLYLLYTVWLTRRMKKWIVKNTKFA